MFRFLLIVPILVIFSATDSHAARFRVITDMGGRRVKIPVAINRVYAVGHCLPMVNAVAPGKTLNSSKLTDAAKQFLPKEDYEKKAVPISGKRFSDEEIVGMRPDIVILEAIPQNLDAARRLQEKLNIPVVLLSQDMTRYTEAFRFLGAILDRKRQAALLSVFVAAYLDPIRKRADAIPGRERVRVYYAENPDGLSTNPSGSIHTQVLDFVGAVNVARVVNVPDEGFSQVSMEQLMVWQPDVILVWTPGGDRLMTYNAIIKNPLWSRLEAVKNRKVIQIPWLPFSWFDRPPGSNRIIGVIWLANLLYPSIFKYDMVKVTREYFRLFYHYRLSAREAVALLSSTPQVPMNR